MFKKCLENQIVCHEGDYKCYLCHYEIKQNFDLVEEHLLTDKHKQRLNRVDEGQRKNKSESLIDISESQLRLIVENRITFDKGSVFFFCHFCKCVAGKLSNALAHITEVSHRIELKKFTATRTLKKANKMCNNNTAIQETKSKSINSEAPISEFPPDSNPATSGEATNDYYCNICKSNITQHRQDLLHQPLESESMNSTCSPILNSIIYDEKCNLYHCTICKCTISGIANVLAHVKGFLHQTIVENKNKFGIEVKHQEFSSQIVFETQKALKATKIESSNQETILQENSSNSCFSEICSCDTCHAYLENNAEVQCHVTLHLLKEFELLNNFDILEFKHEVDGSSHLKCLLCDYYCVSTMSEAHKFLKKHFETEMHIERLTFFKFTKKESVLETMDEQINGLDLKQFTYSVVDSITPYLLCNVCDVPVPCAIEYSNQHVSGKSHEKNLSKIQDGATIERKVGFDKRNYKCFMCNKSFSDVFILLDHYKTAGHKWKIEALKMTKKCSFTNFQKSSEMDFISCSLCDLNFFDFLTTMEHILGKKHSRKLKSTSINQNNQKNTITTPLVHVTNELEHSGINLESKLSRKPKIIATFVNNQYPSATTTKNLRKNEKANNLEARAQELNQFSTKNIQPFSKLKSDTVENVLDNLVPLDFSNSQNKKLPSSAKSPHTPKVEDQTISLAKDVLLNGKHYVKFCIDPGPENIYNFDDEKMNSLYLGVSLTMPYHSYRVCFPCGQQFPDDVHSLFEHLQKQEHLNNTYEMQVEDKYFEDYPEQFSHLRLAELYMHVSDEGIQCHACNVQIADDDKIIRQHAEGFDHTEKSKLWKEQSEQLFNQYLTIYREVWYYAQVFFCQICKKRCKSEINFVKHLIHPEHAQKVYELQCNGVSLTFDLCHSCITYWFGITNSYDIHCKNDFHKYFAKSRDFMIPNLNTTASEFLNNIDKNVDFLESEANKAILGKDKETTLLRAITETVNPAYPDAKAYIFGSRLSYLGFPDSDVDVFLDLENVCYTSSTQEQSRKYIKSVRSYFETTPNIWIVDEVLLPTRVPIIKLRHMPTNLKCDISFINGLSVEKSRLVGLYNGSFRICRQLILFMKKWLTLCRLYGSDYITTFAISWMVIFYLQQEGILPTVHELIKRKKESKFVNGWQCGFIEKFSAEKSDLSIKDHLKGLFTYFAEFDYQKNVICPYLGKAIDKRIFVHEHTNQLPTEMNIYKERLKKKEVEIFRFESPMCIQDPIDLSQNMTKAVKKRDLRCFRHYCVLSAKKC